MPKMLRDRSRVELEVKCDYGCCRTNDTSRTARHSARQMEKRELSLIVLAEISLDESWHMGIINGHIYDGERCIYCNANIYDPGSEEPCSVTDREPFIYTSETPKDRLPNG